VAPRNGSGDARESNVTSVLTIRFPAANQRGNSALDGN
jgi:hypothetical protein